MTYLQRLKGEHLLVLTIILSIGCTGESRTSADDEPDATPFSMSDAMLTDLDPMMDQGVMTDLSQSDSDAAFNVMDATVPNLMDLPLVLPPYNAQFIEAEPQRQGDPEQGYHHFINSPFVGCGIPLSVFERVGDANRFFPLVGLPAEEAYLEGRVGGNAELPYFFTYNRTANDVEVAAINCMSCHAGVFQDQLLVGLGNSTLNTTNDVSVFANGLGALVNDPAEREAWAYWAERMSAVAPDIVLDTKGVVAADNMALVLFGRRDPSTLEWQDDYQIEVPEQVPSVPLAVPPLWRMGKKHAMFYSGSFRGDHSRYMFAASSLCLTGLDEFMEIDSYFHHVRAWIASLQPPAWPYEIDEERVERGEFVFERTCSGCHGTYGETESYPNLVIPAEEVGTDPLLLAFEQLFVDALSPWFAQTPLTESNYLVASGGYIAPPLDGIWITAPYLHNDSIPSLLTLLDSSRRPMYWRRATLDSNDFDQAEVGWRYEIESLGRAEGASADVYDTTRMGYLNEGHLYGDHLNEAQRLDLVEYLKTL
jgi:hypothetical protein